MRTKIEKNLQAYIDYYGDSLGRLEWNKHLAEERIRAYHKKRLVEERQKNHLRSERVYETVSRIVPLNASDIDSKNNDELCQYIIDLFYKVFADAQTKLQESNIDSIRTDVHKPSAGANAAL